MATLPANDAQGMLNNEFSVVACFSHSQSKQLQERPSLALRSTASATGLYRLCRVRQGACKVCKYVCWVRRGVSWVCECMCWVCRGVVWVCKCVCWVCRGVGWVCTCVRWVCKKVGRVCRDAALQVHGPHPSQACVLCICNACRDVRREAAAAQSSVATARTSLVDAFSAVRA